jgi:L-amino acid N-acyltransferase
MIRCGRLDDCRDMARIFNAFISGGGLTDTEHPVSTSDREAWLAAHSATYPVYVWDVDGKAAGWSSLSPFSPRPTDPRLAEVGVYIAEEWRGHGFGGALVRQILDDIDAKINTVMAIVFAGNHESQRLFERQGFTRAACLREPAILRGKWEDVLWYAKVVKARV